MKVPKEPRLLDEPEFRSLISSLTAVLILILAFEALKYVWKWLTG